VPELKRILTTRIVSTPAALDEQIWPDDQLVLRTAPDEVLISPPLADASPILASDPHAIVVSDGSFAGIWLPTETALEFLEHHCEWELPSNRPAFAQGAVAGIATKLWFEADRILFIAPAPMAAEFEERLG